MKQILPYITVLVLLAATGCAGWRDHAALRAGEDDLAAVMRDLAANDAGVRSIGLTATGIVAAPDIQGEQVFSARVKYRRPSDLMIEGTHRRLGARVFDLVSTADAYSIDMRQEDLHYRGASGETVAGVPFPVTPALIARELFFPVDWAALSTDDVRVTKREAGTMTLEIGTRHRPEREVVVSGPPWVVEKSVLFGEDGAVIAESTRGDFTVVEGARLPREVDANFPVEQTRVRLKGVRNIRLNETYSDATFEVRP